MTREELRAAMIEELGNIAPEADVASADEDVDLREALDLDSMDIFNLIVALSRRLASTFPTPMPSASSPLAAELGIWSGLCRHNRHRAPEFSPLQHGWIATTC